MLLQRQRRRRPIATFATDPKARSDFERPRRPVTPCM